MVHGQWSIVPIVMNTEAVKSIIKQAIPDAQVFVQDPMNDGQHLQAIVISPSFEGMMLIKQHQMVMKPLREVMAAQVHALGLKTFTPSKWQEVKKEYGF